MPSPPFEQRERPLGLDIVLLVLAGIVLGVAYNAIQLAAGPAKGLPWIRHERAVLKLDDAPAAVVPAPVPAPVAVAPTSPKSSSPHANPNPKSSTPPAVASTAATTPATPPLAATTTPASDVPVIPDAAEPLEATLASVRKLHDANAATFVDARGADEYAEAHIAGAVNLSFDASFKNPDLIKLFDDRGKPIVTYCGGGDCDLSRSLAFALLEAGHHRVVVYTGGMPEWQKAGLPVKSGAQP